MRKIIKLFIIIVLTMTMLSINVYAASASIAVKTEISEDEVLLYITLDKFDNNGRGITGFVTDIEYDKTILSDYDIIPLHSNVLSLKGKKPKYYNYIKSNKFIFDDFDNCVFPIQTFRFALNVTEVNHLADNLVGGLYCLNLNYFLFHRSSPFLS